MVWGMLHLDDGSYIDWFVPHVCPTLTAKDSRHWKRRDITHYPLSMGGLFHDVSRQRTEKFSEVRVIGHATSMGCQHSTFTCGTV